MSIWKSRSGVLWYLIIFLNFGRWYLFSGWLDIFRLLNKCGKKLSKKHQVSRTRQCIQLFVLVYGHTIPAKFYYLYRLYQIPEVKWLSFVYTHELPYWHELLSPNRKAQSLSVLANKAAFSQLLSKLKLPTVKTYSILAPYQFDEKILFSKRDLFIKPKIGSRMENCYRLKYINSHDKYMLTKLANQTVETGKISNAIHLTGKEFIGKELIGKEIYQSACQQEMLIQPLLYNHQAIFELVNNKEIATVRVVTKCLDEQVVVLFAVFEVPLLTKNSHFSVYDIDCQTGLLKNISNCLTDNDCSIDGQRLPGWNTIVELARKAHTAFIDIRYIGWDFAVATDGVKLLEGNFNWSVVPHMVTIDINNEFCY
ncbi:sugar-transfer associated ATP-grasp domain-containing protein [Aliikangiella sp. GXAS 311]|uniref:Sugar-transfer associated ATP-grasp domain-containing protein n=3 Tax=Aliikangiella maris TaxID=3162458 RepID=A0ABV3MN67_9GAMM